MIREAQEARGLEEVYKRQPLNCLAHDRVERGSRHKTIKGQNYLVDVKPSGQPLELLVHVAHDRVKRGSTIQ